MGAATSIVSSSSVSLSIVAVFSNLSKYVEVVSNRSKEISRKECIVSQRQRKVRFPVKHIDMNKLAWI